jgi:hypothetical protein
MLFHIVRPGLTQEQTLNYVLSLFRGREAVKSMFKAVIQEAAALASLSLFVGMIAIWTQVLGKL